MVCACICVLLNVCFVCVCVYECALLDTWELYLSSGVLCVYGCVCCVCMHVCVVCVWMCVLCVYVHVYVCL